MRTCRRGSAVRVGAVDGGACPAGRPRSRSRSSGSTGTRGRFRRRPRARDDRGGARGRQRLRARRPFGARRRGRGVRGVEPRNVVLGAGADDLILLCARAFAGPGDEVAIASEPTYPLYRVAAGPRRGGDGGLRSGRDVLLPPEQPDGRARRAAGRAPARRRRGVLRVRGRDGGRADRRRRGRPAHVLQGVRTGGRRVGLRARG